MNDVTNDRKRLYASSEFQKHASQSMRKSFEFSSGVESFALSGFMLARTEQSFATHFFRDREHNFSEIMLSHRFVSFAGAVPSLFTKRWFSQLAPAGADVFVVNLHSRMAGAHAQSPQLQMEESVCCDLWGLWPLFVNLQYQPIKRPLDDSQQVTDS
jgi:hypothetical protein